MKKFCIIFLKIYLILFFLGCDADNSNFQDDIDAINSEMTNLKNELNNTQIEISNFKSSIIDLNTQISEIYDLIDTNNIELVNALNNLENSLDSIKSEFNSDIDLLRNQINFDIAQIRNDLSLIESSDIDSLKIEMDNLIEAYNDINLAIVSIAYLLEETIVTVYITVTESMYSGSTSNLFIYSDFININSDVTIYEQWTSGSWSKIQEFYSDNTNTWYYTILVGDGYVMFRDILNNGSVGETWKIVAKNDTY